jgi:hypothetical protein
MNTHTHTTHTHIQTHTHTPHTKHTHTTHTHTYIHTHTTHTNTHTYTHNTDTHTNTHTHTYNTDTHTYTHTQLNTTKHNCLCTTQNSYMFRLFFHCFTFFKTEFYKLSKNVYSQGYRLVYVTCFYITTSVRFWDVKRRNCEHFHFILVNSLMMGMLNNRNMCCVRLSSTLHDTQYTHHNLKHMLPQHCRTYNDVFLLINSTKV